MPALGLPVLVGDAEADDAEPRIGRVQVPYLAQHIRVDQQPVVVELDDDIDVPELTQALESYIAAAGAPEVLVDLDGGHFPGQSEALSELRQRAAVAHDHDPRGGDVLLGHGGEQGVDLGGPVPHGHHGNGDPRPLLHL